MYSITFSALSLKQLKKLDKKISLRIISTIKRCRFRPYSHVKKLVDNPYFCLRVGDYRVIMRIINNELNIFIVEILHRKNVYKTK